jgi:hypothetical protein
LTITIFVVLPVIVKPDFVIELETITAIYAGIVNGGFELLPGSVNQVAPHEAGVVKPRFAKSLNEPALTAPPLKEFCSLKEIYSLSIAKRRRFSCIIRT